MKYLITLILLASSVMADDSSCIATSAARSAIVSRDANLYYRVPASSRSTIRFTRPDSLAEQSDCTVSLKSKLIYRNGTSSRIRTFAKAKDLTSSRVTWTGPIVRRVLDIAPRGRRIRSVLYIAADVSCGGTVLFQTNFVGRYVPNCGASPILGTADAYRSWLSSRMK